MWLLLSKPQLFVPQKTSLLWLVHRGRVTRDTALFLYAPRLPRMEAGSYKNIYALCCRAPPVRRVGQLSAAVPWYFSASPLPVECNRFTWAKLVLAGEVTLQLCIETRFSLGACAGHCSERASKWQSGVIDIGVQQWSVPPLKGNRHGSQATPAFFIYALRY